MTLVSILKISQNILTFMVPSPMALHQASLPISTIPALHDLNVSNHILFGHLWYEQV